MRKKDLLEKFEAVNKNIMSEEEVVGLAVTNKARKESGKFNKDNQEEVAKKLKDFEKTEEDKKFTPKKRELSDEEQKLHDTLEISHGLEDLEYDLEPNKEFKDRVKKGITGDPTMGNGSSEEMAGVVDSDFPEKMVKDTNARKKAKDDATLDLNSMGDDIEYSKKTVKRRAIAVENSNMTLNRVKQLWPNLDALLLQMRQLGKEGEFKRVEQIKNTIKDKLTNKFNFNWQTDPEMAEVLSESKTKTIKRLKYKTQFENEEQVLKLIPESYKTDNKIFEMTDGDNILRVRWEGDLNGQGVILTAKNTTMVKEDKEKIKKLYTVNISENYKHKTDVLSEAKVMKNMMDKIRIFNEEYKNTCPDCGCVMTEEEEKDYLTVLGKCKNCDIIMDNVAEEEPMEDTPAIEGENKIDPSAYFACPGCGNMPGKCSCFD